MSSGAIASGIFGVNTRQTLAYQVFALTAAMLALSLGIGTLFAGALWLLGRYGIALTPDPVWRVLAVGAALGLPAYVMSVTGAMMMASVFGAARRAMIWVRAVVGMGLAMPGPFTIFAIMFPNESPVVIASLLPVFAPLLLPARAMQVQVPGWQIGLALVLIWGLLVFNLAFVARLYRASLWIGDKHRLRSLWQALRGK